MALLFCDSFDHYTTVSQKYNQGTSGSIGSAQGRFGNGIRLTGENQLAGRILGVNAGTLFIGGAYRFNSTSAAQSCIFVFLDNGSYQCSLVYDPSTSKLEVRNGQVGTVLADSGSYTLPSGFNYIEWKVVFGASGSTEVRVNGVTVITASSINTKTTANSYANQAGMGRTNNGNSTSKDYDDLYICDTTGSLNNDFLGDVRVDALFPSGAGDSTQFTPSTGSNYQCVDETPPNSDTDYVSSSTTGHKDLYAMGDLATAAGAIKAVVALAFTRKDDAGTRTLKTKVKSGSTEGNGANVSLSTSYAYQRDTFETNPATSSAWTESEVNGMQAGVEVVA